MSSVGYDGCHPSAGDLSHVTGGGRSVVVVDYDAVILAGGGGERLGGTSKADLVVGGRRLLDIVLDAVPEARTRVVVGDVDVPYGVLQTLEEPPGGGPAAGVLAGLDAITEPSTWTTLLACDLPGAIPAVAEILAAVDPDQPADGWCATHSDGHLQWLLGVFRTASLRRAFETYVTAHGVSMRRLLSDLTLVAVESGADVSDLDTPEDLARWGGILLSASIVLPDAG